ncbi:ABC transporter transmembrane domain-containing protein [Mammaliicoccus sciuri]|uniref:ABC transporter transmembrane domain-containing protein n=1 Tax=Mammaliicoccus sciuri TaxID=1296 RepID=UPI0021D03705|nr:ABC transporter ATP-binding protein [Mammaliicoccus sciuri]UXU69474.1 ABC transporter ATP-binding protein/permease [Mammaliicoccus sciuri]
MKIFINYIKNTKSFSKIICLFLLSTISVLLSLPIPYFLKYLLDDVIKGKNYDIFKNLIIASSIILISQLIIGFLCSYIMSLIVNELILYIRNNINSKFMNENKRFQKNEISQIQILLLNDTEIIGNNILTIYWGIAMNILLIVAYILILLKINIYFTLINFIVIPFIIYIVIKLSKKLTNYSMLIQKLKDYINYSTSNTYINILEIKLLKKYDLELNKIRKELTNLKSIYVKRDTLTSFINIVIVTIFSILPMFILYMGAYLVLNEQMTIGLLLSFYTYQTLLFTPIMKIISLYPLYQNMQGSIYRVKNVMEPQDNSKDIKVEFNLKDISFQQAIFIKDVVYENSSFKLFIDNLNIFKKDIVYIVGENGSGKSTFIDILLSLHKNIEGHIFILNKDILSLNLFKLAEMNIMYLNSESNLIKNNNDPFNQLKVDYSKLFTLINNLKLSHLFDNQFKIKKISNLSNGERQKINIIILILSNPKIIILDEAFSNIDSQSMKYIFNLLKNLEVTLIFTSHAHIDLCKDICNRILKIENNILKEI